MGRTFPKAITSGRPIHLTTDTLLQYGLQNALEDFYRDYLIELIEHEAENELNPGTHPTLALGLGQRFASTGYSAWQVSRIINSPDFRRELAAALDAGRREAHPTVRNSAR